MTPVPRFGEQRLVRPEIGSAARLHFQLFGVADPAHYLHNRVLRRLLLPALAAAPTRILDAGCGRADHSIFLARCFPQAQVLGIDIDAPMIARNTDTARRLGLGNVEFAVGDLTTLDAPETYDVIVSIDVLEHITEQQKALTNLARALKPGGTSFYHIPTVRERPVPFSRFLGDFHAWGEEEHVADDLSADEFTARVAASGLEVLKSERTFGYWTGELATSLFAMPYKNTPLNVVAQLVLAVPGRALAMVDELGFDRTRYAVGVLGRKR
ncbi:MAG: class I SAM-dependent methyltransferase [Gemmatimonadaceae bacterium]|nr:class I SAM-dependent methyltransferase [Gemmatimonadaceae bacterium]